MFEIKYYFYGLICQFLGSQFPLNTSQRICGKIPSHIAVRLTARYWVQISVIRQYFLLFVTIHHYLRLFATTALSLLFTAKFSSARQFKNQVQLFSTFLDESHESQCKKKTDKKIGMGLGFRQKETGKRDLKTIWAGNWHLHSPPPPPLRQNAPFAEALVSGYRKKQSNKSKGRNKGVKQGAKE